MLEYERSRRVVVSSFLSGFYGPITAAELGDVETVNTERPPGRIRIRNKRSPIRTLKFNSRLTPEGVKLKRRFAEKF